MDETKKKTCKMCFQEIDRRAKKCPYCHHLQSKFQSPLFTIAIPIVIVATAAYLFTWFIYYNYMIKSRKSFSQYQDQIVITNTELKFGVDKCDGATVAVLGKMTNNSDVSWDRIQIEVQFFDSNKKLIDTAQEMDYQFMAPANSTVPFKVSMKREFPEEQYDSFNVRILFAKERAKWF